MVIVPFGWAAGGAGVWLMVLIIASGCFGVLGCVSRPVTGFYLGRGVQQARQRFGTRVRWVVDGVDSGGQNVP